MAVDPIEIKQNSIVIHHNDFNIGRATDTIGMELQPLAQNVTIQMNEGR
jgi:hypothetical protein